MGIVVGTMVGIWEAEGREKGIGEEHKDIDWGGEISVEGGKKENSDIGGRSRKRQQKN